MISNERFTFVRGYLLEADKIFRKLNDKGLLNNKKKKEIKNKLRLLNHYLLLNNPKIKNKRFKQENFLSFLNYLENLNSSRKAVSDI